MSTYVVTGGSAGIGLAIARRLGRDGHEVVLAARDPERLAAAAESLRAEHTAVRTAALDVRDPDAVTALFEELPAVDGLVNNAAGNFACPTVDLSPGGFKAVVEISLYGCFHASQALARRLIKEGRPGAIVNIVATYAWTGAPGVAHSAAAKGGMLAFTKSVAREWGPHGIRVNALAPGFVPTESATANILSDDEARQRMLDMIPLGRFAEAEEIADATAHLLGAPYTTGTVLTVDGGRSLGVSMHARADTPGPAPAGTGGH
ncbi:MULTISPECIES: SDR family oxidoreductase [unclassified Streptomyces]|uniref:SDR family oxidoreductase n=1 Tax=unclassified Streptomyces TaxID=2593676 RepID=UPI000F44BDDA|nr:SDR family oxidoreductase [Streptomyces sp. I6]RNL71564.1 SDR family oxidoreductase [Streptomyces sp. I6]